MINLILQILNVVCAANAYRNHQNYLNLSKSNVPIFDATGSDFIDDAERI